MADLAARSTVLRPSALRIAVDTVLPVVLVLLLAIFVHVAIEDFARGFYPKLFVDIGINIVLAVSLNLVNGFTGQFSIGHAGFMAVGGYTAAAFTTYVGGWLFGAAGPGHGFLDAGPWLFVASCLVGGVFAAGAGWVVGLPSLRLKGDYLALVTLGFGEIIRVLLQQTTDVVSPGKVAETPVWELPIALGGSLGFSGQEVYTNVFWVWLFVGITLLISFRLKDSAHGRAFLAIREDEVAAEAMGIPTTRLKVRAFVMSAFFAGVAGALFAHVLGNALIPKEFGFQRSFLAVIMVVLGGMGSISGTTLAAIVLTILPEALRSALGVELIMGASLAIVGVFVGRWVARRFLPPNLKLRWLASLGVVVVAGAVAFANGMMFGIGASWLFPTAFKSVADFRMILYSLVLVAMMILRPQGLFGLHEVWDVWRNRAGRST